MSLLRARFWGVLAACWLATVGAGSAFGAEPTAEAALYWPHWRGPEANGVSTTAQPPLEWGPDKNVRWKVALPGHGKSTPIIWRDRVYVVAAIDTRKVRPDAVKPEDQPQRQFGIKFPNTDYRFVVLCLDRDTGRTIWEQTAVEEMPHEGHHGDNSFASASPVTDGQRLYVSFGSRGFFCFDLEGKLLWKQDLSDVTTRLSFGEASSPVVHGDTVALVRDNEGKSEVLAWNARTGELRWRASRDEVSAWATPLTVEHSGHTQLITSASRRVISYDLLTGKVLWECGGQVSNVTPSPVRLGDTVICMSGYRGSTAMALPLSAQGDITDSKQVAWRYQRDTPYVPSPLLYGDLLYFPKLNSGVLTTLNARTGEPVVAATRVGELANVYASPVGAADRVYFVSREGTTVVFPRGNSLQSLAVNHIDEPVDASPALAGKQLFLRGAKHLYCLEAK